MLISNYDYGKLCNLDCLGIEERHDDSYYVYEEFEKQFRRGPGSFYETNLIWKNNPLPLKNNKSNNLGRLSRLENSLRDMITLFKIKLRSTL